MITDTASSSRLRVKAMRECAVRGDVKVRFDRYLIDGAESGGLISLVEHGLGPRILAAPIHRHSREDEYSLVLEGRLGVFQDGAEGVAEAGELVVQAAWALAHLLERKRGSAVADP